MACAARTAPAQVVAALSARLRRSAVRPLGSRSTLVRVPQIETSPLTVSRSAPRSNARLRWDTRIYKRVHKIASTAEANNYADQMAAVNHS